MAKSLMVLDRTEAELEKEIQKDEKRLIPTSKVGKYVHDTSTLI